MGISGTTKVFERFVDSIPDQHGKTVVTIGGTRGIGLAAARALVAKGVEVVIAARDPEKGQRIVEDIRSFSPAGSARFEQLDTLSLESVDDFVARWNAR